MAEAVRDAGIEQKIQTEKRAGGPILERCKESAERQFYFERTKQFGWTKHVLIHQIKNKTYEKTLLNQTNFESAVPEHIRNQANLAVNDEYPFDFLELGDEHGERQVEQASSPRRSRSSWKWAGCFHSLEASTA